jgi:hypothetical protein
VQTKVLSITRADVPAEAPATSARKTVATKVFT